ncbi:BnaA07g10290D [Brassica napus]|uniref:(rape) hypothetical protein n=1 Tax=Brassica napus TaxID=3708 RepID=A0A078GMB9_BRANA|nr:unnamed protein product [Brassica napus]CDY25753.1 BnaA07g10290D [Brassica napus]
MTQRRRGWGKEGSKLRIQGQTIGLVLESSFLSPRDCQKSVDYGHGEAKGAMCYSLFSRRILRCWGGGGIETKSPGCTVSEVKEKIQVLLEEYVSGGDMKEACRCVKELGMPFFHHDVFGRPMSIGLWAHLGIIHLDRNISGIFGRDHIKNLLDRLEKSFPSALCLGGSLGAVQRLPRGRGYVKNLMLLTRSSGMIKSCRDAQLDSHETSYLVADEEFLPVKER